jgi:hypothetical protein
MDDIDRYPQVPDRMQRRTAKESETLAIVAKLTRLVPVEPASVKVLGLIDEEYRNRPRPLLFFRPFGM